MKTTCFKLFVVAAMLLNFGISEFPESLPDSFRFYMYSPETGLSEKKQITEKNVALKREKGSVEGSVTDLCVAPLKFVELHKQSGVYIDLGSNDLYFRSKYDGYPRTIKFTSFENYLQERKFPSLLQGEGPKAWTELKKFVWRLYNKIEERDGAKISLPQDKTQVESLSTAKQNAQGDTFILPNEQLVYMKSLVQILGLVATMWIQTEDTNGALLQEWKNTAFFTKELNPKSYERFLLQAYDSFIQQVAQERHLTYMLSQYSGFYEASGKKTFVDFKDCIADTDFNFYMELDPVGRSFLEIRQNCPSPVGAAVDTQILFAFKMLYGLFVMHQKGYAHCNIELRNFVFEENLEDFYLINFSRALSFSSKEKCQQGNPAYEAPEYTDLKPAKWTRPEEMSAMRHHMNFELDAFAVGKAILDMLVSSGDYNTIKEKHQKIAQGADAKTRTTAANGFYSAAEKALSNGLSDNAKALFGTFTESKAIIDMSNLNSKFGKIFKDNNYAIAEIFLRKLISRLLSYKPQPPHAAFCEIIKSFKINASFVSCDGTTSGTSKLVRYPIKIAILVLYEIHSFKNKPELDITTQIRRIATYLDDPSKVVSGYGLGAIPENEDIAPTEPTTSDYKTDTTVSKFKKAIESIRELLSKQRSRILV